jgi:hypothetical protein
MRAMLSQKLFALSACNYHWRLNRVASPSAVYSRRIIKVSNIMCVISLIVGAARTSHLWNWKTELNVFLRCLLKLFARFCEKLPGARLVTLAHLMRLVQLSRYIRKCADDRRIKKAF